MLREVKSATDTGLFESLANSIPALVWIADASKACVWVNKEWLDFTGRRMEQEIGRGWIEGIHPDDVLRCLRTFEQHHRKRTPYEIEFRLRHHSGDYRWVLDKAAPRYNEKGQFAGYTGACIDISERRMVEETLQESELHIRLANEATGVGIWAWNVKTNAIKWDARMFEMYGLDPTPDGMVTYETWRNAVLPEDLAEQEAKLQEVLKEKKSGTRQFRIRRYKDQQLRSIQAVETFRQNEAGDVEWVVGTNLDITEQLAKETHLRDALERYNLAVNGTTDGIWDWNPVTNEVYFSPRFKEMLGYRDDEMPNRVEEWDTRLHPDDKESAWQAVDAYLKGEIPQYQVTFRMQHKDGSWRWIMSRAVALRDAEGNPVRMSGAHTDMTEIKQLETRLKESEGMFRSLAESIPQLAWMADESGWIFWYNQRWYDFTGTTLEDMQGWGWEKVHDAKELPRIKETWQQALQSGTEWEDTFPLRGKDGTFRWFLSRARPIRDENGRIVRWFGTNTDITEHLEMTERLKASMEAAEAANIAKTEFLANMSHEIRTPMNAVVGLANILSRSEPLSPKQRECIQTLQLSADALLALINDLLDISKIESRSIELESIPFCFSQLVEDVVSIMSVRAREKKLHFTLDEDGLKDQMFEGDPTRIRQIILNLCSNAVKFTENGGVHLIVRCHDGDTPEQKRITLRVEDTGIGIPEKNRETIFQKFVQADSSINRKYGGSGLGLAITKTLADVMGGSIAIESEVGKGSVFTVTLPLKPVSALKAGALSGMQTMPLATRHGMPCVLLVEDYEPNVMVASTFLEHFGYGCEVAVNGHEAVQKVKEKQFALALMDVQMHGMNGFEATRLIREFERMQGRRPLPIIGMTAHALTGDREKCLSAGMDDYIAKPFDPDELQRKIGRLVQAQSEAA